jgi:hypothetical protein
MAISAFVARTSSGTSHHNTLVLRAFAILVINEIGIPLKGRAVKLKFNDGHVASQTTDEEGKVYLDAIEAVDMLFGQGLTIELEDSQEVAPGDSTRTNSGHHFALNQGGPSNGSALA